DGGCLAGPIWPQQSEDLAALNLQVQRPQGGFLAAAPKVSVYLGQVPRRDNCFLRHGVIASKTAPGRDERWIDPPRRCPSFNLHCRNREPTNNPRPFQIPANGIHAVLPKS